MPVKRYFPGKPVAASESGSSASSSSDSDSDSDLEKHQKVQKPRFKKIPQEQPRQDARSTVYTVVQNIREQLSNTRRRGLGGDEIFQETVQTGLQNELTRRDSEDDEESESVCESESEGESGSGSEGSSGFESSSSLDSPKISRLVFVSKSKRDKLALKTSSQTNTKDNLSLPGTKDRALNYIEHQIRTEAEAKRLIRGSYEEDLGGIDDTDDLDPEKEKRLWELRELKRLKREKDELVLKQQTFEERQNLELKNLDVNND